MNLKQSCTSCAQTPYICFSRALGQARGLTASTLRKTEHAPSSDTLSSTVTVSVGDSADSMQSSNHCTHALSLSLWLMTDLMRLSLAALMQIQRITNCSDCKQVQQVVSDCLQQSSDHLCTDCNISNFSRQNCIPLYTSANFLGHKEHCVP